MNKKRKTPKDYLNEIFDNALEIAKNLEQGNQTIAETNLELSRRLKSIKDNTVNKEGNKLNMHSQLKQKSIEVSGCDTCQITKDELIQLAFDAKTPDELSKHYKEMLIYVRNKMKKRNQDEKRFLYFINHLTNRVRVYFK